MFALLLLKIFLFGFLLNVVWEMLHSQLYTTCLNQAWTKNIPLLLKMSVKDGLWIVLFYAASVFLFGNWNIFGDVAQLVFFVALGLAFGFIDESISIGLKRWEYAPAMPTIFGVGITPLLEIPVSGVLTLFIVFYV